MVAGVRSIIEADDRLDDRAQVGGDHDGSGRGMIGAAVRRLLGQTDPERRTGNAPAGPESRTLRRPGSDSSTVRPCSRAKAATFARSAGSGAVLGGEGRAAGVLSIGGGSGRLRLDPGGIDGGPRADPHRHLDALPGVDRGRASGVITASSFRLTPLMGAFGPFGRGKFFLNAVFGGGRPRCGEAPRTGPVGDVVQETGAPTVAGVCFAVVAWPAAVPLPDRAASSFIPSGLPRPVQGSQPGPAL